MIVFDTSILLLLLDPKAGVPLDPETEEPVTRVVERIDYLIDRLSEEKKTILIPTPVLSEVLVRGKNEAPRWLEHFRTQSVFRIVPFDQKAAIETAILIGEALEQGGLKVHAQDLDATRGKVKFDRQILDIARTEGAEAVYSDDKHLVRLCRSVELPVYRTADLELPPSKSTQMGFFEGTEEDI